MLAQYLVTHTTVQRIEAATEVGNVAEQRALEKAGFTGKASCGAAAGGTAPTGTGFFYSMLRTDRPG